MKSTQPDDSSHQAKNPGIEPSEGIAKEMGREVSKGLLKEAGTTLKWGFGGAVVGAIVIGGVGFWKFGLTGLGIGAIAGAVLGGVGGVVLYIQGTSLTM